LLGDTSHKNIFSQFGNRYLTLYIFVLLFSQKVLMANNEKKLRGRIIIIEGNISAGKTTLCLRLRDQLGCKVFLEPTLTNPFLEEFYKNPKEFALRMQLWLLRQRFRTYVDAVLESIKNGESVVLDRSVFSDWVFAEQGRRDGVISPEGFDYYKKIRESILCHLPKPDFAIYLQVEPDVCHYRIHELRKRDCESGIPVDYLNGLHKCYENFITNLSENGTTKTLTYDWNKFGQCDQVIQDLLDHAHLPLSLEESARTATQKMFSDANFLLKQMDPESVSDIAHLYEDSNRLKLICPDLEHQQMVEKRQRSTTGSSCVRDQSSPTKKQKTTISNKQQDVQPIYERLPMVGQQKRILAPNPRDDIL